MLKSLYKSLRLGMTLRKLKTADSLEKEKAELFLEELLAQDIGVYRKFAQHLGGKKQISKLSHRSEGLITEEDLKLIFERLFEQDFSNYFIEVEKKTYQASVAQVFIARDFDGEQWALKVQYPGIKETIHEQMKLMDLFPLFEKVGPGKKWGIPLNDYQVFFKRMVDDELDYKIEIANHKRFQKYCLDYDYMKTAKLQPSFQSEIFYIQSYEEGEFAEHIALNWEHYEKEYLGRLFFESFLNQIFDFRFFQGDSNQGNFLFRKSDDNPVIVFLDFGNCFDLSERMSLTLLKLIKRTIYREQYDPYPYLIELGFDQEKLSHIRYKLPYVMEALLWPLLEKRASDLNDWDLDEDLNRILGEYKWWFRSSGGTEFFSLMKAFSGYSHILKMWKIQVPFRALVEEKIKKYEADIEKLVINEFAEEILFQGKAKSLKIRVFRDGKNTVDLTFPSSILPRLDEYISYEIQEKLKERGISIQELIKSKIEDGGCPGDIFKLIETEKEFWVYLE